MQILVAHAVDAALRLLVPSGVTCDIPLLTPREKECLRWTMDGKTAWELGKILGITEQTAVRHLKAMSRFVLNERQGGGS
jgi:DNA-binding NarL/FixJ family response regulator